MDINLWYGTEQNFVLGQPQRWINVLGTITEPQHLLALMVRLNGGDYHKLHVGPDGLRLRGPGDFNAEFPVSSLLDGENQVEFLATDHKGSSTSTRVRVNFAAHQVWRLPYRIRWQDTALISDAVQVVDGKWSLSGTGIRPVHPAYDRLIVIGDHSWTDAACGLHSQCTDLFPGDQGHLQGGLAYWHAGPVTMRIHTNQAVSGVPAGRLAGTAPGGKTSRL